MTGRGPKFPPSIVARDPISFPTYEMIHEEEGQLTLTSMKAHSGTRVPSGTGFEYLRPHPSEHEMGTGRRGRKDERLWGVDGSAVVRPRVPPTHPYLFSKDRTGTTGVEIERTRTSWHLGRHRKRS
jgi:hypothetical protein